jgi:cobalt-zinc-cadmium efflux system membrane fusion protein
MKPNYHPFLFFLVVPILISCNTGKHNDASRQAADSMMYTGIITVTRDQFALADMKLGTLHSYNDAEEITANGYLDVPPENKVRIGTFLGGYIKSIDLIPGDRVRKGQDLVVLENIEYLKLQKDYLDAKEQLDYLRSVYESQKALAEEKISAQRNYLEARSNYNRMLITFESIARQLQLINIDPNEVHAETLVSSIRLISPIDGFITEVKAVKGMFVNPSDVICEIINTDHMHLELKIFEKDLPSIQKGQAIEFRIPDVKSEVCMGEIIMIGKKVEENDRTIMVHGHISDCHGLRLVPGMYVEAKILTKAHTLNGLPIEALVTEDDKHFIFMQRPWEKDQYVFEKVGIKVGKISEYWFEVQDTTSCKLDSKTPVLVKGAYYLTNNM